MDLEADINAQRAYYNERWSSNGYVNRAKLHRCAAILEAVASAPMERPVIIELGCGSGWLTNMLAAYGPATGVDLSDTAVAKASRIYPYAQFLAADVMTWDYPRCAFDLVVSHEVIEHIDDQAGYLGVAHGLLRPGGRLVLTTPNRWACEVLPENKSGHYENQPIEKWLSIGEVKKLLTPGFRVFSCTTLMVGSGGGWFGRLFASRRLRSAAQRLGLEMVLKELGHGLGYGAHILVVAQKRA